MSDKPGSAPVPDEEKERDDEDPGELATTFATKGAGWSGRDEPEEAIRGSDHGSSGHRWRVMREATPLDHSARGSGCWCSSEF